MTVRDALQSGSARLKNSETPFLDAGLLMASVLGISREKLLASYPETLSPEDHAAFDKLMERRISGIPVSYILNRKEFFGRTFYVDERVLVPRPDTEILVETALEILNGWDLPGKTKAPRTGPIRVLDVCTGTGCIPLTLALEVGESREEGPAFEFYASELSDDAIEVFEINRKRLGNPPVTLMKSDLLSEVPEKYDLITSNPPYLTAAETSTMMDSGWPEPAMALDGGDDGLDLVRILVDQSIEKLNPGGWLVIEAAWNQMEIIEEILKKAGFHATAIHQDLGARNRVVRGCLA